MAGVVGGLVVRRPGAALLCEVVAALVSMLPGTKWGASTLVAGVLQGLGAELAFAVLGYAVFGLGAAMLAGALSAPFEVVYESATYYPDWAWTQDRLPRHHGALGPSSPAGWLAAHPGPGSGRCAQRVPARPGAP